MTKLTKTPILPNSQGQKGYFRTNLQVIYYYNAFGSSYLCISFSHERKSERIERKLKTQNPCLWPTLSMFSTGTLTTFRLDSMWTSTAVLAAPTSSAKSLALRSSRISSKRPRRSLLCHRKSSKA